MHDHIRVGDLITFGLGAEPIIYPWWERILSRITFGRYRMRGRPDRRVYRVMAVDPGFVTIGVQHWWKR